MAENDEEAATIEAAAVSAYWKGRSEARSGWPRGIHRATRQMYRARSRAALASLGISWRFRGLRSRTE